MTVVLKIGGSVITEKATRETVDTDRLGMVASDLGASPVDRLVLVHGGGSFGHPAAEEWGIDPDAGTRNPAGVVAVHRAMGRLNDAVLDALHAADVPAIPVAPLSIAARVETDTGVAGDAESDPEEALDPALDLDLDLEIGALRVMLDEGFIPVLYGDVIAHQGAGATVVSGDELVVALADRLGADRIGLCSTVPGVLDETGAVIDRIDSFESVGDVVGDSGTPDVTGGMAGKVRTLLAATAPACIFGPAALSRFLAGETPGTEIAVVNQ